MQTESAGAAWPDIAAPGTLGELELDDAGWAEYQSQFLEQDDGENLMRGLASAIPISLVLWVTMGLLLWALMR
jgi:hypothetical protein